MSKIVSVQSGIQFFRPEDIVVDEAVNARPYSSRVGDTEEEQKAIQQLKESIKAHGQQVPIKVRFNGSDRAPHLIMGTRRLKAIALLNLEGDERQVMAIVSEPQEDESAFRQAVIENLHRKNPNALDNALVIQRLRQEHGWEGAKGTKKVADYLKVSPATVTQHDRLLSLPQEVQDKVSQGVLTMQAGLDLLDVKPEHQETVLENAIRKKQQELAQASDQEAEAEAAAPKKRKGKGKGIRKTKAVGSKHVREAAGEIDGALNKPKPLSKAVILDFFNDYLGANPQFYGYPDSPIQEFLAYFLNKFVVGLGSARTLDKYWSGLIEKAPKGTKASMPTEQEEGKGKERHSATSKKRKTAA